MKDKFFFAVVKADGYGHGGAEVALAVEDIADGFCVSIIDEGAALRLAGITKPVLVLCPPLDPADVARARFYNLQVTVNSIRTARLAGDLPFHIKVNTGMNRYGCSLAELKDLLNAAEKINIAGVYSHLYAAEDDGASRAQLKIFKEAAAMVKSANPSAKAHLAASGGILRGGEYLFDGARAGILLYGYPPDGFSAPVRPVLKVYARLAQRTAFIGGGAGYAKASKNYSALSTYRLGYADGFARTAPLGENNLCMDAFVKEGGGEWELVLDDAKKYAVRLNTIPYEVLCSVTRRSYRIYE